MDLYICEKPLQAEALASTLRVTKKSKGYISNGSDVVITWLTGHLLELYQPHEYDMSLKTWAIGPLPIIPKEWKLSIKKESKTQYGIVTELIKKADVVLIATDYDRQGESICREVLEKTKYKGIIKRVPITSLDNKSLQKALDNVIVDASETVHLHYAAMARSRLDWLIGISMSRIFTLLAQEVGYTETLHVGRVTSPLLQLIKNREDEIESFEPEIYYNLEVEIAVKGGKFTAKWVPNEDYCERPNQCIDLSVITKVSEFMPGQKMIIRSCETKGGRKAPPKPYSLTALQRSCVDKLGYSPKKTLDIAQSLYVKKLISYPRSDSRYLPESQLDDVKGIFKNLIRSFPRLEALYKKANLDIHPVCFNDSKLTSAHHALIVTETEFNPDDLSSEELSVYMKIRDSYVSNFFDDVENLKTKIEVLCEGQIFTTSETRAINAGWEVLFDSKASKDVKKINPETLPTLSPDQEALCCSSEVVECFTKPKTNFTESTILSALEKIGPHVEPEYSEFVGKDSRLGTVATSALIIESAINNGYLVKDKKKLLTTEKARALLSVLPRDLVTIGYTAVLEVSLVEIEKKQIKLSDFMIRTESWINNIVNDIKEHKQELISQDGKIREAFGEIKDLKNDNVNGKEVKCLSDDCNLSMQRLKGSHGFFWLCACKKTYNDLNGVPVITSIMKPTTTQTKICPGCGEKMTLRSGAVNGKSKSKSSFWGCKNFPNCRETVKYNPDEENKS